MRPLADLARKLRAFRRCERGNIAILFAFAVIPLFGVAGLAMDYAQATSDRTRLQSALDGAVLAGVAATGKEVETAQAYFTAAAADTGLDKPTAEFELSKEDGLVGTATGTTPTLLLGVLDKRQMEVGVSAAARKEEAAQASPVCILVLDGSANQAFLANSGAKINGPDCEVHVRSTANPAAIVNSGTSLDVKKICVKGSKTIQNGGPYKVVETNCAAIDDPFAGKLPTVNVPTNCTYNGTNYNANGADVTLPAGNHCNININGPRHLYMQPGLYQGNININGTPQSINLAPGLYIIKAKMNFNGGTVNGTGVTFYYPDSNSYIQFNSNVTMNISAPTSGPYKGILFFEAPNLSKSQFAMNDTHGTAWKGLIYWPSRNVTINSTSQVSADQVSLVVNTLTLNNTNWKFAPNSDWPMSATGKPATGSAGAKITLTR